VGIENLTEEKEEMKMTRDSHLKNSEGSHINATTVGIRKMSDTEFEEELL